MDEGIGTGRTVDDGDSEPTEEQVKDSIFNKNVDILEIEVVFDCRVALLAWRARWWLWLMVNDLLR
jgi:hypothetical protein